MRRRLRFSICRITIGRFLDPRSRHASQINLLTADLLSRFEAGKAKVRATAVGRPQLSRTPPPVVREVEVDIQH